MGKTMMAISLIVSDVPSDVDCSLSTQPDDSLRHELNSVNDKENINHSLMEPCDVNKMSLLKEEDVKLTRMNHNNTNNNKRKFVNNDNNSDNNNSSGVTLDKLNNNKRNKKQQHRNICKSTLIVCPMSLLGQWMDEIDSKVCPGVLKVRHLDPWYDL